MAATVAGTVFTAVPSEPRSYTNPRDVNNAPAR
jgi:hypothetical protein